MRVKIAPCSKDPVPLHNAHLQWPPLGKLTGRSRTLASVALDGHRADPEHATGSTTWDFTGGALTARPPTVGGHVRGKESTRRAQEAFWLRTLTKPAFVTAPCTQYADPGQGSLPSHAELRPSYSKLRTPKAMPPARFL